MSSSQNAVKSPSISPEQTIPVSNATILYTATDFRTTGKKLMGRHAASESFLRAYAKYSGVGDFYCFTPNKSAFQDFAERIQSFIPQQQKAVCRWISPKNFTANSESGCFYTPDPNISHYAWLRRRQDQRAYSICGITHTISSAGSIDILSTLLTAPLQPWDALICTSSVVRSSLEHLLGQWGEYLGERLGATQITPQLQLPVIPLGVESDLYEYGDKKSEIRQKWRERLNIAEEDVVFLFVGRLSFHAKAHPTPMYIALENAAKQTGKRVHLIQSGWFANDSIEVAFKEGARDLCPSVNAIFLDGRDADTRKEIWAVCDVFTSLSDNIQETFGLTPIEAMAAELPVVVSDWNGYKDTVRDGVDGFRVPTLTPPPEHCHDLAERFEMEVDNYDLYIGNTCRTVSVDIAATTKAYAELIQSPDLRKKMGAAGKKRAQEVYDWKHIIKAYQELWGELGAIREETQEIVPKATNMASNPLRDDPFSLFSSYPTATIQPEDCITLVQLAPKEYFQAIYGSKAHNFGYGASETLCFHLIDVIQQAGSAKLSDILATVTPDHKPMVMRSIIEFAKIGLVSVGAHNAQGIGEDGVDFI